MPTLLLALALLAQDPPDDAPDVPPPEPLTTYTGWVVSAPHPTSSWVEIASETDGITYVTIDGEAGGKAALVWHGDGKTPVPRLALQPGVRVRFTGPNCSRAYRVEIHTLGPLAFDVAQESWVAEQAHRPDAGLTHAETATLKALGSESWLVRDAVSRSLREQGPRAMRVVVWGMRHHDAEVRMRCGNLLRTLGWSG